MKQPLRIRQPAGRKISFSGGFLVCVRVPLFCRTVGRAREVRCDFRILRDPEERDAHLVLFSRN